MIISMYVYTIAYVICLRNLSLSMSTHMRLSGLCFMEKAQLTTEQICDAVSELEEVRRQSGACDVSCL